MNKALFSQINIKSKLVSAPHGYLRILDRTSNSTQACLPLNTLGQGFVTWGAGEGHICGGQR